MLLLRSYGRVGSTRLQDVAASRAWQVSHARQLIEPRGGVVVAEFFDIGHTRALPWQRRPKANELLTLLRDPGRGFNAVVIGEPQRAFYGNQFSLTYPIFEHFGVQLWVPEVGGPIDPGSEAHDLAMTLFGSQSKGERMRIKTRVRAATGAQTALQGRFLGGRPPYGYRLIDAGRHPNPPKPASAPVCTPWSRTRQPPRWWRGSSACSWTATATWPSPNGSPPTRSPRPRAMIACATPTGWGWRGASPRSARSLAIRATPATRCETSSAATRSCSTSTTSPPAMSARCVGTPSSSGSGRPSRPTRRWSAARSSTRFRPASLPAPPPAPAPPRPPRGRTRCGAGFGVGCAGGAYRASGSARRPTTAAATPPNTPKAPALSTRSTSTSARPTWSQSWTRGLPG